MVRRVLLMAGLATILTSVIVTGSAFAGKGGNGGGGRNGGGSVEITSFAIASQAPGSIIFSVSISDRGNPNYSLGVSNKCYDEWSQLISSEYLAFVWDSATTGHAGPFSPPPGRKCFAYVHDEYSDWPLTGGVFSYVAS